MKKLSTLMELKRALKCVIYDGLDLEHLDPLRLEVEEKIRVVKEKEANHEVPGM